VVSLGRITTGISYLNGTNTWSSFSRRHMRQHISLSWVPVVLLLLHSHRSDAQSGWSRQGSGTEKHLLGVSISDSYTGTVVGLGGTILHTSNGGAQWMIQHSGVTWPVPIMGLKGVWFTNEKIGTAVGDEGVILLTTDGGANWISQPSGTKNILTAVCFTDVNTGTIVGTDGSILRTSDHAAN
jgi:photosystem II stability/assembly factor-like uncharacterized protein